MLKYFLFKLKIKSLFKKISKIEKTYKKYYKNAKDKNKYHEEMQQIYNEEKMECDIINYEIETSMTTYYLKIANYNFLEIPKFNDDEMWVESRLDPSRKVLSNKAISFLRNKIKEDRNGNIDQIIKIITVITGLIGVIIGLVAILLKK